MDYHGPYPVHSSLAHTWGDCFNNLKNHFTGSWKTVGQERGGQNRCGLYYSNQRGQGSESGYYNPCQLTSIPTLYIQQAPVTNTTTRALSTVTNLDTSSTIPNQVHVIQPMNTNRGETNICWLNGNVSFCDTVMMNHTFNYDRVVCATKIINQMLFHAGSHSHHFHSLHFTFPQDGDLLRVLPCKCITFYACDKMYIHKVDNFQIYINVQNNQTIYLCEYYSA